MEGISDGRTHAPAEWENSQRLCGGLVTPRLNALTRRNPLVSTLVKQLMLGSLLDLVLALAGGLLGVMSDELKRHQCETDQRKRDPVLKDLRGVLPANEVLQKGDCLDDQYD